MSWIVSLIRGSLARSTSPRLAVLAGGPTTLGGGMGHGAWGMGARGRGSSGHAACGGGLGPGGHLRRALSTAEGSGDLPREAMEYDVCIVGAGPAGLAAAIRMKQLCNDHGTDLSVCVVEKGGAVGAHVISGNVFEPRALDELLPSWRDMGAPLGTEATQDRFLFLTEGGAHELPAPSSLHNRGNYILSLSQLVRWLGDHAEGLGVDVFPGFAASRLLVGEDGSVGGIGTGDFGVAKNGSHKSTFEPGMDLRARVTLLGEGCRGSLSQQAMERFGLRRGAQHQTYGLGIKEVWEVPSESHREGEVWHGTGYPLGTSAYGGFFLYHMAGCKVALGLVVGLDYKNPYLSPREELNRLKRHPKIHGMLQGGTCLEYGARALNEGGLQSIPELTFPGGALIGCSAGFLNVAKIKGTHTAMKSGMLAAEAAHAALTGPGAGEGGEGAVDLEAYPESIKSSWVWEELSECRNIRPAFSRWGLYGGMLHAALDGFLLRGRVPWTLSHPPHADHEATEPAAQHAQHAQVYDRPDGHLTFDVPSSLYLSGTNHEHDQPAHLQLRDPQVPTEVNLKTYAGLEGRYCPAGVYEYVPADEGEGEGAEGAEAGGARGGMRIRISAQNCLHCKACDIKDPRQNIRWTTPEGGGGPAYTQM